MVRIAARRDARGARFWSEQSVPPKILRNRSFELSRLVMNTNLDVV